LTGFLRSSITSPDALPGITSWDALPGITSSRQRASLLQRVTSLF